MNTSARTGVPSHVEICQIGVRCAFAPAGLSSDPRAARLDPLYDSPQRQSRSGAGGEIVSKAMDEELARLTSAFERMGSCIVPADRHQREALRRRMRAGEFIQPDRGIYVRPGYWDKLKISQQSLHRMRALTLLHRDWVFCNVSSLVARGFPISYRYARMMHVHRDRSAGRPPRSTPDYVASRRPLEAVEIVNGVRVCSLASGVIDAMCSHDFREALLVGDKYLRVSGESREMLVERLEGERRRRGILRARCAASYADGLSESGGESISRAIMIEQGYQIPILQESILDPIDPWHEIRFDFTWRDARDRIISRGEFDGHEKYSDEEMLAGKTSVRAIADAQRRESRGSIDGSPLLRFSWSEALNLSYFTLLLDTYRIPRSPGCHYVV